MQVIAAEKPLEGASYLLIPLLIPRDAVSFETGRNHGLCLHRLLIEAGPFAALLIKAIGTNGDKMLSFCIRTLQVCQPI